MLFEAPNQKRFDGCDKLKDFVQRTKRRLALTRNRGNS